MPLYFLDGLSYCLIFSFHRFLLLVPRVIYSSWSAGAWYDENVNLETHDLIVYVLGLRFSLIQRCVPFRKFPVDYLLPSMVNYGICTSKKYCNKGNFSRSKILIGSDSCVSLWKVSLKLLPINQFRALGAVIERFVSEINQWYFRKGNQH